MNLSLCTSYGPLSCPNLSGMSYNNASLMHFDTCRPHNPYRMPDPTRLGMYRSDIGHRNLSDLFVIESGRRNMHDKSLVRFGFGICPRHNIYTLFDLSRLGVYVSNTQHMMPGR